MFLSLYFYLLPFWWWHSIVRESLNFERSSHFIAQHFSLSRNCKEQSNSENNFSDFFTKMAFGQSRLGSKLVMLHWLTRNFDVAIWLFSIVAELEYITAFPFFLCGSFNFWSWVRTADLWCQRHYCPIYFDSEIGSFKSFSYRPFSRALK